MGIKNKLPNADVKFAQGCSVAQGLPNLEAVPTSVLFTDQTLKANGLQAEYFSNTNLEGTPVHTRIDQNIDFTWKVTAPFTDMAYDKYSVRWTGYISVPESGQYALGGEAFSGMKLYLDGKLITEREDVHEPKKIYEFVTLEAKKVYQIKLEYKQDNTERAIMRFLWDTPSNSLEAEAIALAKESDVVVLCMGLSPMLEGEEMKVKVDGFSGGDRLDIKLPASQTNLMKKIKELGKPMVLVMLNGSAVAINWENDNIPAILEAWYPGQAGGTAIADILFGDYNPSGRLPLTFYKDINDIPAFNDYSMKGKTYRYFQGKPLYDFGFGLSYTTFEYTNLSVPVENPTTKNIDFTVDVTNTGAVAGDEVVEVYFTNPQGDQLSTIRTLINFDRVSLKAGETKKVSFSIQPKQLAQLNANNSFQLSAGTVNLSVGGMQASPDRLQAKKVIEKNIKIVGQTVVF